MVWSIFQSKIARGFAYAAERESFSMTKADAMTYGNTVTLDSNEPFVKTMTTQSKRIVYLGSKEIAENPRGEVIYKA